MQIVKLTLFCTLLNLCCYAQSDIYGKWITVDDETGKQISVVDLYERNGKAYGKIVKLYRSADEDQDPVCTKCPQSDSRYAKKIIGMEIIKNLAQNGDEFSGGTVLKPDEGEIFKCRLWLEGDELKIRGYWGIFYRTQTWLRFKE